MALKPKYTITPKINIALVEKEVLKKRGEKKGTFYVLSPKTAEKIRNIVKGQLLV
jgi:hypothetical protein